MYFSYLVFKFSLPVLYKVIYYFMFKFSLPVLYRVIYYFLFKFSLPVLYNVIYYFLFKFSPPVLYRVIYYFLFKFSLPVLYRVIYYFLFKFRILFVLSFPVKNVIITTFCPTHFFNINFNNILRFIPTSLKLNLPFILISCAFLFTPVMLQDPAISSCKCVNTSQILHSLNFIMIIISASRKL